MHSENRQRTVDAISRTARRRRTARSAAANSAPDLVVTPTTRSRRYQDQSRTPTNLAHTRIRFAAPTGLEAIGRLINPND
jgi:hypothetical protein